MDLNIPAHVGIIMDGNGRWALARNLKRSQGHLAGSDTLIEIAEYCFKRGIKVLSVFAFSTENFNRPPDEVNFLMELAVKLLRGKLKTLIKNDIKVIFSGRKERLPKKLLVVMDKVETETKVNKTATLNICLNYGGRGEIVDAVKKVMEAGIDPKELDENKFKEYLYHSLPDLDLVIRTSGEYRLSNFLLYQLAYAELYFSKTYWPDFSATDIEEALKAYNQRERRFGKVK